MMEFCINIIKKATLDQRVALSGNFNQINLILNIKILKISIKSIILTTCIIILLIVYHSFLWKINNNKI